ncbi:MAG: class I SAM-dependent methyltransferase [Acidimicrobiia bacterium]|nr:class I SAM-dependent methyltransferase [Acidimicrobiia bacterium]
MSDPTVQQDWNSHAHWWVAEFTGGVDPEYEEQIIPLVVDRLGRAGRVLDLGTGEGQVARALRSRGAQVVGFDPFPGQIRVAVERSGGVAYGVGAAQAIPIAAESVDAVVACLVFEHIDDVDEAIAEVARVLRPGGRFLFLLNHPLLQTPNSGWIDDQVLDPPEQYWRLGEYLNEAVTVEEVGKDIFVKFIHRPLSRYLNALIHAGLTLVRMDEPAPPQGFLDLSPEYQAASSIPRLLVLDLTKTVR